MLVSKLNLQDREERERKRLLCILSLYLEEI